MFSVVSKRTALAARKLFQLPLWNGVQTRCLTRVSWCGSTLPIGQACTARKGFSTDYVTLGLRSVELFQKCRPPYIARCQHVHLSVVRLKRRAVPEPLPRELDLLRYDMRDLWKSPKPALTLGFVGLIPFVAPTLIMAVSEIYCPELAYAQLAYGASILSFLGGARWGFALPESSPAKPDWINLANSVLPALLAWVTMLMSDGIAPAVTMLIMGLGISLHYDLSLLPTYPSWFKALRSVLTIVAFFSLVGTLIVSKLYPEKKLLE